MAPGKGKKEGVVAFAAGIVAAPLLGVAALTFVTGLVFIWYANREPARVENDVAFGFGSPDGLEASEVPEDPAPATTQRRTNRGSRSAPAPRRTTSSSTRSSSAGSAGSEPRSADAPPTEAPGSIRPDAARPEEGMDQASLPDEGTRSESDGDRASLPPDDGVAEADAATVEQPPSPPSAPAPTRTSAGGSRTPGPHEYPDDGEDSWLPDTFRSVVDRGISMLTGEAPEPEMAPATPDAAAPAPSTTRTRPPSGEAEVPAPSGARSSTARVQPRPDDAPPIAPTGTGEPEASVVPETSAVRSGRPDDPSMPFAPVAAPVPSGSPPPTGGGQTLDDLVAGGLDMMTGKGPIAEPVPAPAPRERSDMEEDVAGYVDPVDGGADLELDDDLTVVVEDHDAADSFGTSSTDATGDLTTPVNLDDLVIPVRIRTQPPGIAVQIDGEDRGVSPVRADLSDDDHRVVVGSAGRRSTFTIAPMGNPDMWCFGEKGTDGYQQVPCD